MDLIKKKHNWQEKDLRTIMAQLFLAVDFMHAKQVIHRDLKINNVLIHSNEEKEDYDIRVIDFGLATKLKPG